MNKLFVIEKCVENWEEAIRVCADVLHKNGNVDDEFCQACIVREEEYPTGLAAALGVAIPHTQKKHVYENGICLLRLPKPVAFRRMDDPDAFVQTNFVFNLAIHDPEEQLSTLSKVMGLIQNEQLMHQCMGMTLEKLNYTIVSLLG